MAVFLSVMDYYAFAESVRVDARYNLTAESQAFIRALLESSQKRLKTLPIGFELWRACLEHVKFNDKVHSEEERCKAFPIPCDQERLMPYTDKAREGRINPKGIPCLYMADDRRTAVMEVRPWIGSQVTVAKLATKRDLHLVDFSIETQIQDKPIGEMQAQEVEDFLWSMVNDAFSEPITPDENRADYVPTQIVAEAFRLRGLDGLIFKSSLGTGKNVVLFDLNSVEFVLREVRYVSGIQIEESLCGRRMIESDYWLEEHHDEDVDDDYVLPR
jgi:RES domain-containing protein